MWPHGMHSGGCSRTRSLMHTCSCGSAGKEPRASAHAATAGRLQDSTLHDLDAGDGAVARVGLLALDLADDLQGRLVEHLAENNVLAVEPGRRDGRDKEPAGALRCEGPAAAERTGCTAHTLLGQRNALGAVGVRASVGHGELARLGVLELEVLVSELLA